MSYQKSIENAAKEIQIKKGSFLITGSTGLIGSCMIDVLLAANKAGSEFTIYALGRSEEKIKERFDDTVIPVIQSVIESIPQNINVDYIFHFASTADPRAYATQPVETILTNLLGNKNILDYCKNHPSTKMLLSSTFEIYGSIEGVSTYSEEMSGVIDQTILRNGYPESKRTCELLLRSYVDEYGINAVIARLSSVYGPTMLKSDSKAHAQFINNAVNGQNIVLKSKGEQTRSYTYVIDAVRGMFTIMFKGENGEAYNVASDESIASIAKVAKTCSQIAGTKVVFDLPDAVEAKGFSRSKDCILSTQKLKNLGWYGIFSLENGLRETIEYLRNKKC